MSSTSTDSQRDASTPASSNASRSAHGQVVNGKSIMGLMMLALTRDTRIMVIAEGEREEEAVAALCALVENSFIEA